MLVRRFQKVSQRLDRSFEGFAEFSLFLIAPGAFETAHSGMKTGHQGLQVVVEAAQVLAEPPQLGGIDMGF